MDEVWVGDITYIPLRGGRFGYLSVLMDLYSRQIVGGEYQETMTADLVLASLGKAIRQRQPARHLIHHNDRGGQYAAGEYCKVLRRAQMVQSMSDAGNCYDNAFMESCFGTKKTELELNEYADSLEATASHQQTVFARWQIYYRRGAQVLWIGPFTSDSRGNVLVWTLKQPEGVFPDKSR